MLYDQKTKWKFLLFLFAILIGLGSLLYTQRLVKELKNEERKKVELWAEATRQLIDLDLNDTTTNLSFLVSVIENNNTVPVILLDQKGDTITTRNLNPKRLKSVHYFNKQVKLMEAAHDSIEIVLENGMRNYILYRDSIILTKLTYFPFVQLGIIILFILVAYLAFNSSRKFEQNQVWVGLTKETAHQLGTPTSSLIGWVNLLKTKDVDSRLITELNKDVLRLEKITDRFSKIGTKVELEQVNIIPVIFSSVQYLQSRLSDKVKFHFGFNKNDEILVPLNVTLFEWVIENLIKNAIDAIKGDGLIDITLIDNTQVLFIDFSDSGKGIQKSKFKTVFKPGFTTKDRGWGLGLSLSKRIVEIVHGGKIFVQHSEPGKGSTFRVVLNK